MNILLFTLLGLLFLVHLTTQACTSDFTKQYLARHNEHRAKHGVANLTLNDTISTYSQEWAESMLSNGKMEHRNQSTYGENLFHSWYPDQHALPANEPVDWYYNEIRFYDYFGEEPDMSEYDKWTHFTQVVWKDSKSMGVGCAISSDNKSTYIVSNYLPMGNIVTQFKDNVPAPESRNLKKKSSSFRADDQDYLGRLELGKRNGRIRVL